MVFAHVHVFVFSLRFFFFFKQKTAYEMRISDWSSDVCSSDLQHHSGGAYRKPPGIDCGDRRLSQQLGLNLKYVQLWERASPLPQLVQRFGGYWANTIEIGRASCRERVCQYV